MFKKTASILVTSVMILSLIFYWNFTVFVVHPVAGAPDGATLVLPRGDKMAFIDSADAMCARQTGAPTPACRSALQGSVYDPGDVYAQLPYSDWLYGLSTGGAPFQD